MGAERNLVDIVDETVGLLLFDFVDLQRTKNQGKKWKMARIMK